MQSQDRKASSQANYDSAKNAQMEDQNYLSQSKFDDLLKTKQKMQEFIKKVGEEKISLENNIVFRFCGKYETISISSGSILQLLDKRIQRMAKNRRIKRNWSEGDIDILVWVLTNYAIIYNVKQIQEMSDQNWKQVSQLICGTTGESCMFKILSLKKIKLSEQQWTKTQSDLLLKIVSKCQKIDWKEVSQQLFNINPQTNKIYRNSKQCKQHWTCYLNPILRKGPWLLEEDILLLEYIVQNNGKRKWAQMAKIFRGRTENALKNRYSLILQKQKSKISQEDQFQKIKSVLFCLKQRELKIKLAKSNVSTSPRNQLFQEQILNQKNIQLVFQTSNLECKKRKENLQIEKQQQIQLVTLNNMKQQSNGLRGFTLTNQNLYPSIIYPGNQFFMLFNV